MFGKPKTIEVQEGEKILGYDEANLVEYRKMQEAQEVLDGAKKKGFRKPSNKELVKAKEIVHEYRRKKAETYLEEHKGRITYYGVEIKAYFETLPNGLIKPSLTIADFNPFKELAPVKPWSEALEENLATRINCNHKLNEDGTVCEKCQLNPENWGSNNEGVSNEYQDGQRERIATQKARELACSKGDHELNDEAKKDPNAPLQFCVHCRKPKKAWEVKKEAEDTEVQGEQSEEVVQ